MDTDTATPQYAEIRTRHNKRYDLATYLNMDGKVVGTKFIYKDPSKYNADGSQRVAE